MSDVEAEVGVAAMVSEATVESYEQPALKELTNPKKDRTTMPGKYTPKRLLAMEKARKAVELRKMGLKYDEIAKQVGYGSGSTAAAAVKRALSSMTQESGRDLKRVRYEQLNDWMMRLQVGIAQGDPASIQTAMRVAEYQDRLMGVEQGSSTAKTNVIVIEGDEQAWVQRMKEMTGEASADDGDQEAADPWEGWEDDDPEEPDDPNIVDAEVVDAEDVVTEDTAAGEDEADPVPGGAGEDPGEEEGVLPPL